jgi:hypothetical protein
MRGDIRGGCVRPDCVREGCQSWSKSCWEPHFLGLLTRNGFLQSLFEGGGRPGGGSYVDQECVGERGGGGNQVSGEKFGAGKGT